MSEHFSVALRLPRNISDGDIIDVKAKIKHPSRTGLQLVETATTPYERFVRNQPAEYVRLVEVYYAGELISTFQLNSSSSDDPLLTFKVRADKEGAIRVVVTNHLEESVEVTENVEFSLG